MAQNNTEYKNKFGRTTVLTLNVLYTLSIVTFLYSIYCYFGLGIKGAIFYNMISYSLLNAINIAAFYVHKNILFSYNIASVLGFFIIIILSYYSGGINSPVIPFLVLLIYFGYLISEKHGNLWFVVVSISIIIFYVLDTLSFSVKEEILPEDKSKFNMIFLFFLIVLLGGVFGRMMNKINLKIKSTKNEILRKNNEKSVMLREIHHRVKNNLQIVNSLLRIQSRNVKDESVKEMFKVAQSRIVAMARLHENIYNTEDLKNIDIASYFKLLIKDLISSKKLEKDIQLNLNIQSIDVSIDTLLPLSLIINEFVSNSLKHAFKDLEDCELFVELKELNNKNYNLIIGDNGNGIDKTILENGESMGLSLIRTFVRQLNGSLSLIEIDNGTRFKVSFSEISA